MLSNKQLHYRKFSQTLIEVPEIQPALRLIDQQPNTFLIIADQYLELLNILFSYTNNQVELIKQARNIMLERQIDYTSASGIDTAVFIKNLLQADSIFISSIIHSAFDLKSSAYNLCLNRLGKMMTQGSELVAKTNEKPQDGIEKWDRVIWTHTQLSPSTSPEIMLHVPIAHYLSQYFLYQFNGNSELKLSQKDDFLEVFTDIILLETANNRGPTKILDAWITPKAKGGLGWILPEQLEVYREVIQS
jgi:hypothetical protein